MPQKYQHQAARYTIGTYQEYCKSSNCRTEIHVFNKPENKLVRQYIYALHKIRGS